MVRKFVFSILAGAIALASLAAAKTPEKAATAVDSGSFGVFVNGQRVATESFNRQQRSDASVATSELKSADGKNTQHSELQLSPAGDLRHYEWRELSPGKAQATVEPMDEFLVEKITIEPGTKAAEKPFILPTSTLV